MRSKMMKKTILFAIAALALTACVSTTKPSDTPQSIEKPVLPPVPSELLITYERPERPTSGSPKHLLTHAVEYGQWCNKQNIQLKGWQSWYRQE